MLFYASNAVMLLVLLCVAAAYAFVLAWRVVSFRLYGQRTVGDAAMALFVLSTIAFAGRLFWTQVLHF